MSSRKKKKHHRKTDKDIDQHQKLQIDAEQVSSKNDANPFAHLEKKQTERLITWTVRLYPSQIAKIEEAAKSIPGVTATGLLREIVAQALSRFE